MPAPGLFRSMLRPFLLILLSLATVFCGCSGEVPGPQVKRIIILTNGDDPFWDAMRRGMEQAAEDMKLKESGLTVYLDKGDFSEEAQINKLKQYATQSDIGAVAISSVDAKNRGIAEAMRALRKKGVHVICIDSDMNTDRFRDTRFAYLGTNNVVGGHLLGRAAKALKPDGGRYATFVGLKTVANAQERIAGFKTGAGPKFTEVDSLADGGDENKAQENVKAVLKDATKNVDTLVGIWAYNAHAIVHVVKEFGVRKKTTVVVFDAAPLALDDMKDGQIDAMVVQNPYQMGYLGTKLMKALIEDDHKAIHELYPAYEPAEKKFTKPNGDIYNTELRIVVPGKSSPIKQKDFATKDIKFFLYDDFRKWLNERKLTGS